MKEENNMEKILELINVEKYYGSKGNITKALDKEVLKWKKASLSVLWAPVVPVKQRFLTVFPQ